MTPSFDTTDIVALQDEVDQLTQSLSRVQQTIRGLQNVTNTGIGSTLPAHTRSGITVPAVSGVKATTGTAVAGETAITVRWIDAPEPTGASVDHYNVYAKSAFTAQSQPTLIGAAKQSPCVCAFQPSSNVSDTIFVQTVLSNGQALKLSDCPTATLTASKPATSLITVLQGYVYQPAAQAVVTSAVYPLTILSTSNGNGGALLTIGIYNSTFFTSYGATPLTTQLRITIDGSSSTSTFISSSGVVDTSFTDTAIGQNGNELVQYYGIGFATSAKVELVANGPSPNFFSGAVRITAAYALHT